MFLTRSLVAECEAVREAAQRRTGLRHYDVQVLGGLAIHRGAVAEMDTGEGKTLTATIPAFLQARQGRTVLIATSNDYLARRDAELMAPVYEELGLSVSCIQAGQPREDRRAAYACDIVYGTAREFGFDFLRDRLEERRRNDPKLSLFATGPVRVQREPGFLLLDEADSLLIDEARTPLIISGPLDRADPAHEACYRWAAGTAAALFEGTHFRRQRLSAWPALTQEGRALVRWCMMPELIQPLSLTEIHHFVERAIFVNLRYVRDRHYVVREGKVQIVDEYTGRIQPGRTWNDGIHQSIEAREELPLTAETGHLARVTMQEFVRRFPYVGGMTGTAREAAREFRHVYGLRVRRIPTNRPVQRQFLPDAVYRGREEKFDAIVGETIEARDAGRAALIGTPTIALSQTLSERFSDAGIEHVVLNALNPEAEAGIVAEAGQPGRVTIATNMAGRGTDIRLGDSVLEAGGLHVIGTELHTAGRIDRQLVGRCGRQGDPGTFRQYLSLEDEILPAAYGDRRAESMIRRAAQQEDGVIWAKRLRKAQRRVEQEHYRQRQDLMGFDREMQRAIEAIGLDPVLDAVD